MISSVLKGYYAALEADDITADVANASAEFAGEDADNSGDIDLNTDDILGTKSEGGDVNPDEGDPTAEDPNNMDTDMPKEPSMDENGGEDSMQTPPPEEEEPKDSEFENVKKDQLWDNYKRLYEVFDDSIDLITQYVPQISDSPTIHMLKNLKENLVNSRDLVYRTIVDEYPDIQYSEMMKRYIGLNHIYDISIKELEEYFDKYRDEIKK